VFGLCRFRGHEPDNTGSAVRTASRIDNWFGR
jgi:hypothetical protein